MPETYLNFFYFFIVLLVLIYFISAWQQLVIEKNKYEYLASKYRHKNDLQKEIPMSRYNPNLKNKMIENFKVHNEETREKEKIDEKEESEIQRHEVSNDFVLVEITKDGFIYEKK